MWPYNDCDKWKKNCQVYMPNYNWRPMLGFVGADNQLANSRLDLLHCSSNYILLELFT